MEPAAEASPEAPASPGPTSGPTSSSTPKPVAAPQVAEPIAASGGEAGAEGWVVEGAVRPAGWTTFEPTVGVTSEGAMFLNAYSGGLFTEPGKVVERYGLQRSLDAGLTWTDVTPRANGIPLPPQDWDPFVHVDQATDRVFVSASQAAACTFLSFSDDLGATWTTTPLGCGATPGVHDHQNVFTAKPRQAEPRDYPNVVYLCVNRGLNVGCATSLDGGMTFGPYNEMVIPFVEAQADVDCDGNIGLTGHGTASAEGIAYLGMGVCEFPTVSRTEDDGLTWKAVTVSRDVRLADFQGSHEVSVAVDAAGNVYAAWIGQDLKPYLAVSLDKGDTWSRPRPIGHPEVLSADFPALVAGDEGRVAMAYYGSPTVAKYGSAKKTDPWHAYLSVLLDAHTEAPTLLPARLNPEADPLARGVCGATRCDDEGDGTAGVGDFIGMALDFEGRPWVALVDVCKEGCPDGAKARGMGLVGTLAAGPRLRGEGALPPLPG